MKITIKKTNLAPIFYNVITQKIKIEKENQIVKTKEINPNKKLITLLLDKPKAITFQSVIEKRLRVIKIYDKYLYKFVSLIKNQSTTGIFEPKSKIKVNKTSTKIKENKNTTNTSYLSQYGNGIFRMTKPIQPQKQTNKVNLSTLNQTTKQKSSTKIEENKIKPYANILSKYLKAISILNFDLAKSQNIIYQFNKNNKISSTYLNSNINTILEYSFRAMSALISKPVFVFTPNKVVIQLFFFFFSKQKIKNKKLRKNRKSSKFIPINLFLNKTNTKKRLQLLSLLLSKYFKKPVELELERLYYPYYDSQILANLIGLISNIYKFRRILHKVFFAAKLKNPILAKKNTRFSIFPSFLSGLKIKLAGRLMTQRVVPRLTVKTLQRGTLARGKADLVSEARFTSKNRRGAYSITVTMGHSFF